METNESVNLDNSDGINIYDDLDDFDLGEEIEKLKAENRRLKKYINSLQEDVKKHTGTIIELKETQSNLMGNISTLFLTAKAEIERKDRMIEELRTQVDNTRINRFNPKYANNTKERENNPSTDTKREDRTVEPRVELTNQIDDKHINRSNPDYVGKRKDRENSPSVGYKPKKVKYDNNATNDILDDFDKQSSKSSDRDGEEYKSKYSHDKHRNYEDDYNQPYRSKYPNDRYNDNHDPRYESRSRYPYNRYNKSDKFRRYNRQSNYEDDWYYSRSKYSDDRYSNQSESWHDSRAHYSNDRYNNWPERDEVYDERDRIDYNRNSRNFYYNPYNDIYSGDRINKDREQVEVEIYEGHIDKGSVDQCESRYFRTEQRKPSERSNHSRPSTPSTRESRDNTFRRIEHDIPCSESHDTKNTEEDRDMRRSVTPMPLPEDIEDIEDRKEKPPKKRLKMLEDMEKRIKENKILKTSNNTAPIINTAQLDTTKSKHAQSAALGTDSDISSLTSSRSGKSNKTGTVSQKVVQRKESKALKEKLSSARSREKFIVETIEKRNVNTSHQKDSKQKLTKTESTNVEIKDTNTVPSKSIEKPKNISKPDLSKDKEKAIGSLSQNIIKGIESSTKVSQLIYNIKKYDVPDSDSKDFEQEISKMDVQMETTDLNKTETLVKENMKSGDKNCLKRDVTEDKMTNVLEIPTKNSSLQQKPKNLKTPSKDSRDHKKRSENLEKLCFSLKKEAGNKCSVKQVIQDYVDNKTMKNETTVNSCEKSEEHTTKKNFNKPAEKITNEENTDKSISEEKRLVDNINERSNKQNEHERGNESHSDANIVKQNVNEESQSNDNVTGKDIVINIEKGDEKSVKAGENDEIKIREDCIIKKLEGKSSKGSMITSKIYTDEATACKNDEKKTEQTKIDTDKELKKQTETIKDGPKSNKQRNKVTNDEKEENRSCEDNITETIQEDDNGSKDNNHKKENKIKSNKFYETIECSKNYDKTEQNANPDEKKSKKLKQFIRDKDKEDGKQAEAVKEMAKRNNKQRNKNESEGTIFYQENMTETLQEDDNSTKDTNHKKDYKLKSDKFYKTDEYGTDYKKTEQITNDEKKGKKSKEFIAGTTTEVKKQAETVKEVQKTNRQKNKDDRDRSKSCNENWMDNLQEGDNNTKDNNHKKQDKMKSNKPSKQIKYDVTKQEINEEDKIVKDRIKDNGNKEQAAGKQNDQRFEILFGEELDEGDEELNKDIKNSAGTDVDRKLQMKKKEIAAVRYDPQTEQTVKPAEKDLRRKRKKSNSVEQDDSNFRNKIKKPTEHSVKQDNDCGSSKNDKQSVRKNQNNEGQQVEQLIHSDAKQPSRDVNKFPKQNKDGDVEISSKDAVPKTVEIELGNKSSNIYTEKEVLKSQKPDEKKGLKKNKETASSICSDEDKCKDAGKAKINLGQIQTRSRVKEVKRRIKFSPKKVKDSVNMIDPDVGRKLECQNVSNVTSKGSNQPNISVEVKENPTEDYKREENKNFEKFVDVPKCDGLVIQNKKNPLHKPLLALIDPMEINRKAYTRKTNKLSKLSSSSSSEEELLVTKVDKMAKNKDVANTSTTSGSGSNETREESPDNTLNSIISSGKRIEINDIRHEKSGITEFVPSSDSSTSEDTVIICKPDNTKAIETKLDNLIKNYIKTFAREDTNDSSEKTNVSSNNPLVSNKDDTEAEVDESSRVKEYERGKIAESKIKILESITVSNSVSKIEKIANAIPDCKSQIAASSVIVGTVIKSGPQMPANTEKISSSTSSNNSFGTQKSSPNSDRPLTRRRITPTPVKENQPPCSFESILIKTTQPHAFTKSDAPSSIVSPLHLTDEGEIPVLHLEEHQINNLPTEVNFNDKNIINLLDTMNISNIDCDIPKFKNISGETVASEASKTNSNDNGLTFENIMEKVSSTPVATAQSGEQEHAVGVSATPSNECATSSMNITPNLSTDSVTISTVPPGTTPFIRRRRRVRLVMID